MPTFSRVRRKRGPALAWAPSQDTYYELARMLHGEARAPLYLTQAAILEFEAHLRESSSPLPFGLLAGEICICPETKLEYLLVDTVARARVELAEDDPYGQLAEELQSLTSEQAKQRKLAIGWYLGGMADDLTLDDEVASVHRELFPERWQVALVRGREAGIEHGAFLRYESIWSRWYSVPFFEFLSEWARPKKGEARTAIRWANYRTDEPARPLEEFEVTLPRANAAPRSWWGSRAFGTSLEPFRRAARGTAARAPERTPVKSVPVPPLKPAIASRPEPAASVLAPRPVVTVPPFRSAPPEVKPPPHRAPDQPHVEPAERMISARVEQTVAAPVAEKSSAPVEQGATPRDEQPVTVAVEQRASAPVEQKLATPAEYEATTTAELRVAATPELKVASTADLVRAAPAKAKVATPTEVTEAALVEPRASSPAKAKVLGEASQAEVQHVFIDGSLVPAPLAYEFPERRGMLPSPDRVRISSLVVGALLLLMLLLLYLIAS